MIWLRDLIIKPFGPIGKKSIQTNQRNLVFNGLYWCLISNRYFCNLNFYDTSIGFAFNGAMKLWSFFVFGQED